MSFETARKAIHERFDAQWTTTPKFWANENVPKQSAPWVRLTIIDGDGWNAELGVKRQRYAGVVIVQVFVKEHTGTGLARTYADSIAAIFRNAQFSGDGGSPAITCRVPNIREIGARNNDNWYQVNIATDFFYDVTI